MYIVGNSPVLRRIFVDLGIDLDETPLWGEHCEWPIGITCDNNGWVPRELQVLDFHVLHAVSEPRLSGRRVWNVLASDKAFETRSEVTLQFCLFTWVRSRMSREVVRIDLGSRRLRGTLSPDIAQIRRLRVLSVRAARWG